MKYIILLLSIAAATILISCSEDVQGPNKDTHSIIFDVTPDTVNILAGEATVLKAFINDTVLSVISDKPLYDKTVIWQIIMGGGTLSTVSGDSVVYQSITNLPQQKITAIIKAFPRIDVRHQRYVVINIQQDAPTIDTGICFRRDILPIFNSNCAISGCHNKGTSKEGYILDSYQNIMRKGIKPGNPNSSKIYKMITNQSNEEDDRMPPPPKKRLTSEQISLIARWIAEGAMDKDCSDTPIGGCDTTTVTYSKTIVPVLELNCLGCHTSVQPQGNVTLEGYSNVKKYIDNGKFLGAIQHKKGYVPMPDNNMRLSDCNLRQLEIWVQNGAPNN
ncbi:MAG: hypothetical protein EPN82_00900 [Bacteroidetes bacterium]|nr:MAG: hypothetical protein EPN82_00900 [Bacteroidota bacterium]